MVGARWPTAVTPPPKRKQRTVQTALCGFGLTGLVLPGLFTGASPAAAATAVALYVAQGGTGDCTTPATACGSIQAAIDTAQGSDSGDDVTVHVGVGTFTENDVIAAASLHSLTVDGAGAALTTADGGHLESVFRVRNGTVTLSDLTITGGLAGEYENGGGINNAGDLTVASSTISGNTTTDGESGYFSSDAGDGGGIQNSGTLSIVNSSISGNTTGAGGAGYEGGGHGGFGGGINNTGSGTLSIVSSTISGNTTGDGGAGSGGNSYGGNSGDGGGISNVEGAMTIVSSTISGNTTGDGAVGGYAHGYPGDGGGVAAIEGSGSIADSTISGNTGGRGGGIDDQGESLALTSSTISGNTSSGQGGGIYNESATLTMAGTIVANSTGGRDCAGNGSINDHGYNLADDSTCGLSTASPYFDQPNTDPLLGSLANNGGPTMTMFPVAGSPAVGAIPNPTAGLCPTTDQRGIPSSSGQPCDIGSVSGEPLAPQTVAFTSTQPSGVTVGSPTYTPTATGGGSTSPVVISLDPTSTGCALTGGTVSFTSAGTCVIDVNQAGDTNYTAALQAQQSITVSAAPSFGVLTGTLPAATRGHQYTPVQLQAEDVAPSTAPYVTTLKWSKGAALPAGLQLSTKGVLSGTPPRKATPGTYPVTATVTETVVIRVNARLRTTTRTSVTKAIPITIN